SGLTDAFLEDSRRPGRWDSAHCAYVLEEAPDRCGQALVTAPGDTGMCTQLTGCTGLAIL
ncbi:MAG: hypothetical protein R6W76_21750, partial [Caldilinea sp.]